MILEMGRPVDPSLFFGTDSGYLACGGGVVGLYYHSSRGSSVQPSSSGEVNGGHRAQVTITEQANNKHSDDENNRFIVDDILVQYCGRTAGKCKVSE